MGDYGRIQALVIATMKGHVVYERFYSTFTDLERAEMRAALQVTDALRTSPLSAAFHGKHRT